MENIVLIVHLILALCLIGVVLLQRSEGGGLGMGGGGGAISSRGVATALTKLTWIFAVCFIGTSIFLTILAAQNSAQTSVVDRLGATPPATESAPALPGGSDLLPPATDSEPLTPPRAD
ncbi:preprotein translocase subunit SecG [Oceaniglobus roseus]|uniref:preprotein translocase subunit SecG n=1 Tax=Oceaniglobus roseus TaxID=1737570 RepID=UPI000C7F7721|nr:preprotein translocase subunit SecG [Kandeliimicrobium roseum]